MDKMKILMADVGGTNVKLMVDGSEEVRKVPSGREFTGKQMVKEVLEATSDWKYDAITLGFPGLIEDGRPVREPLNLGGGWLDFDFEKAFGKPVRFINDASMQALAHYKGGRMLFLGFGTSIGASYIIHDVIVPLELGLLRFTKRGQFMDRLCKAYLKDRGRKRWQRYVEEAVELMRDVLKPTDIMLGGGNAKLIDPLPEGCRVSANQDAFLGARRVWPGADMLAVPHGSSWRIQHG